MTQTTKEIFEKYEIRKTKAQKTAFIDYVKSVCEQHKYNVNIEHGSMGARNIVVGDPDKAKVFYTAHYDTCPRLPFPNIVTPKNFGIYLMYQFLIVFVFLAIVYGAAYITKFSLYTAGLLTPQVELVVSLITSGCVLVLCFLMLFGPANKHTANDNTSGVTTLLDIMTTLPEELREKVCFVFFDLEEVGLVGSSSFAKRHKETIQDKLVINFDCVSDGDTMLFATKNSAQKYRGLLEQSYVSNDNIAVDVTKKWCFYPSDNMNFKGGVGVASLNKTKRGILYMDKIHTKKDTVYKEENIEFLRDGAIKLLQEL